ncbi:MAG: cyanophycinase [Chloroflexi bacterium HGW-Chloroflexi-6]|nr:MAG: cyanophycinase [Chloroflexi bacterium HGW-Chloroflexi-6]
MNRLLLVLLISAFILPKAPAPGLLIPIGGGYSDIYAGFSEAAIANAHDNQVKILVLPSAYSTNPLSITEAERQTNLRDAEERRFQIEEACKRAAPPQLTCQAVLAPVFVRSDAENPETLSLFTADLSAIFALGGDQTVAMQAIIGTPLEARLMELNQQGVIFAGTSAGGGMQSAAMLAGYNPNYAAGNALNFGAADVWNSSEKHGLTFGLKSAILDQHFHQRGRLPRLLNAISLPGVPHLGVGVDAYTGVIADDEVLRDVFGLYTVTILDAETYHAAEALKYVEAGEGQTPYLSLRNVLVTILSAGDFSYNLKSRTARLGQTTVAPFPKLERRFETLKTPQGAGTLLLSGGISENLDPSHPVFKEFAILAGASNAKIGLIGIGYASETSANNSLDAYAKILPGQVTKIVLKNGDAMPLALPADLTAILLTGKDPSKVNVAALQPVKDAWLNGTPLLADNAAASLIGDYYSAHGPISQDADEQELATQKAFRQGKTKVQPGLGLVSANFEPQLMDNNRWGRFFSLAYTHPDLLALGLSEGTALRITSEDNIVLGSNPLIVLDLRQAKLAIGESEGFVIANALLDVFAPGEILVPEIADTNAAFSPAPTPVLSVAETRISEPNHTIAPTQAATPTPNPPTSTPERISTVSPSLETRLPSPLWGIGFGLLLVIGAVLVAFIQRKQKHR